MRTLTKNEMTLIAGVAQRLDEKRAVQLLADAEVASAEEVVPDASRVIFGISGYQRPIYRGQHSFGIDAKMCDVDGAELSVCLYADENDRLLELEIIRWDSRDLQNPQWSTLEFLY